LHPPTAPRRHDMEAQKAKPSACEKDMLQIAKENNVCLDKEFCAVFEHEGRMNFVVTLASVPDSELTRTVTVSAMTCGLLAAHPHALVQVHMPMSVVRSPLPQRATQYASDGARSAISLLQECNSALLLGFYTHLLKAYPWRNQRYMLETVPHLVDAFKKRDMLQDPRDVTNGAIANFDEWLIRPMRSFLTREEQIVLLKGVIRHNGGTHPESLLGVCECVYEMCQGATAARSECIPVVRKTFDVWFDQEP